MLHASGPRGTAELWRGRGPEVSECCIAAGGHNHHICHAYLWPLNLKNESESIKTDLKLEEACCDLLARGWERGGLEQPPDEEAPWMHASSIGMSELYKHLLKLNLSTQI